MSFFHSRKKDYSQATFWLGFFGLGIVVTGVILFWSLLHRGRHVPPIDRGGEPAIVILDGHTAKTLINQYMQDLTAAEKSWPNITDPHTLMNRAEDALFAAHVPQELLTDHFNTLIEIRQMERTSGNGSIDAVRTRLTTMFERLRTAATGI